MTAHCWLQSVEAGEPTPPEALAGEVAAADADPGLGVPLREEKPEGALSEKLRVPWFEFIREESDGVD